jgi:hypothetical protein
MLPRRPLWNKNKKVLNFHLIILNIQFLDEAEKKAKLDREKKESELNKQKALEQKRKGWLLIHIKFGIK